MEVKGIFRAKKWKYNGYLDKMAFIASSAKTLKIKS